MKSTITAFVIILMATACGNSNTNNQADPQASPGAVAEAIFEAARSGSFSSLPALIDPDADGDSKRIAEAATNEQTGTDFQLYFSKGKVSGEPTVNGDKASVNILFGPDGTREETLEMVRKNGKWYLVSF